ncbi:MAG: NADH-quinone oxidoreductase subunit N [Bradymonadaceae bacterium]
MPIGHVTPEIALLVGAVICLLAAVTLSQKRQWIGAALTGISTATAAGFAWHVSATAAPQLTFHGTWALDAPTTWATWTICAATALVASLSPKWFQTDRRHGEWYALLLFSALGAVLLAGAADVMELMVGMLLTSVAGYTLASFHRRSPACAEAGAKYFFLGALTNSLLFLGIVLVYGLAGTTGYAGIREALAAGADPVVATAAFGLVVVGIVFELGAVPVHPWVPDVSEASPAPAAAFLTVVPKIGALVALARFVSLVPEGLVPWRELVAGLSVLTMTVGNLAALWQSDVRRLLGWSSVSQAGYGLMAVVALGAASLALPALIVFVVGYTAANLAAFGVVTSLRGRTDLEDYRGLAAGRPLHAAALTVAMLSLTGIPPLVGFFAKFALFGATLEAGFAWLAVAAVLNTVVSLFYYLRVVGTMVLERPGDRPARLHRLAAWLAIGTSLATLVLGLLMDWWWPTDPLRMLP